MGDSLAVPVTDDPGATADAPGWLYRLVAWIERLPWPAWMTYAALFVAGALFWHVAAWQRGAAPSGDVVPASLYWAFLLPAMLWITGYLARGAMASFDTFRSILLMPADEAARLRDALAVVPARPALLLTALGAVVTLGDMASNPADYTAAGMPPPIVAGEFVLQAVMTAGLFQLLYLLVRQATLVRRTLAQGVTIDIFRPAPLHAFAAVTARPGIVVSLLIGAAVLIVPVPTGTQAFLAEAPYLVLPPVIAVVAFVLPLTGAHGRLADQKERLQEAAELRLEAMLGELNRDVDARDLGRADGLNKTLSSLVLQRDVLTRLPTWPWSVATVRGLVSAILLPMALFLIQQAVARII